MSMILMMNVKRNRKRPFATTTQTKTARRSATKKKKRKENAAEINRARNASKAAYKRRVEEQSRLLFAKERGVIWEPLRIYDPLLACELVVGNETGSDGATSFEFRWQAEQFARGRSAKFGTVLEARECEHDVLCVVCGAAETARARASKKARCGVRAATPDEEAQDECRFVEIYWRSPKNRPLCLAKPHGALAKLCCDRMETRPQPTLGPASRPSCCACPCRVSQNDLQRHRHPPNPLRIVQPETPLSPRDQAPGSTDSSRRPPRGATTPPCLRQVASRRVRLPCQHLL
ncbi:hypothetical protein CTAYLR_010166, partial [Chrysophaeum taylorii]